MTEMVQGEGQGSSNFAPAAPVSTPSSTPQPAPTEERTFKQSEVNDLVGRAKQEAVDRYKRDSSMASHNTPQTPQYTPQPTQTGYVPPAHQSSPQHVSTDEVRRLATEEIQRSRNEWQQEQHREAQEKDAQRIAHEFFTKVGAGEGGLQGFEKIVTESGVDLRSIPYHVQLANNVDNTREVMEELMKNPAKIGAIQNLIDIDLRAGRTPNLAMAEMKKLSQSIKENAKGAKFQSPNEPLSQLRPSNAGTGTQGALSIADYKRKYRI